MYFGTAMMNGYDLHVLQVRRNEVIQVSSNYIWGEIYKIINLGPLASGFWASFSDLETQNCNMFPSLYKKFGRCLLSWPVKLCCSQSGPHAINSTLSQMAELKLAQFNGLPYHHTWWQKHPFSDMLGLRYVLWNMDSVQN
jgi:hypothetical protein